MLFIDAIFHDSLALAKSQLACHALYVIASIILFMTIYFDVVGFVLLLHFFLRVATRLSDATNFCCDQTVVLFPNHSALHLFHQGCRHLIIFVGCRKTFKSLATHLAQNAACVPHYMAGEQQISSNKQYPPSLPNESSHLNSNASIIL